MILSQGNITQAHNGMLSMLLSFQEPWSDTWRIAIMWNQHNFTWPIELWQHNFINILSSEKKATEYRAVALSVPPWKVWPFEDVDRAGSPKNARRICCGKFFNSKCQCRNSFAPEQQFKVVELLWINSNLSRLFQINPKSHPDVSASTLCPLLHHEQTAPGESASSLVPV